MSREMTPAEVQEMVSSQGLLARDSPVVAMVSGGRDSTCLLDVAVAVRGAESVRALHVNYGLRGEASDADERCVAELCAKLGVEIEVVRAQGAPGIGGVPGNTQAWARDLRYAAAMRLAQELDAGETGADGTLIATGHTASDQVETILYRLAASPGRRALLGMAAREGRLVRPLLGVTRTQTAAYCRAQDLKWREDKSNDDEHYARARVRKGLLPALCAVHPAAAGSVLKTAEMLRAETELLDGLVDEELAGSDSITVARLAELHPALARLVVVRLAEDVAGDYVPQAGARVDELLALARRGGRAEVHVGGNVSAVIADGRLSMARLPPR